MKESISAPNHKRRICLIAIYLGKLPNWLPVWLRSCELNPGFDFLFLTDRPQDVPFRPANVKVELTSLAEIRDRISTAAGFEVSLNHAFKLCDFRPIYGTAFRDMLKAYHFWGHTDLDLFYGNLAAFFPEEALGKFVRLYHRGHMSIFRNDVEGNNLYRLSHPTVDWREVFRTDDCCHFDEYRGIELLTRYNRIPEFENNYAFADIVPKLPGLRLTRKELNHRRQAFVFDNGRAQQIYMQDGRIQKRDFMYVHLQKRAFPDVDASVWRTLTKWVCTPQGFIAGAPESWNELDLRRFNRPNYRHAITHAWRRAARRLNRTLSRQSS